MPPRERVKLTEEEATDIGRALRRHPGVEKVTTTYTSKGYPLVMAKAKNGLYFPIATHEQHMDAMAYLATMTRGAAGP